MFDRGTTAILSAVSAGDLLNRLATTSASSSVSSSASIRPRPIGAWSTRTPSRC